MNELDEKIKNTGKWWLNRWWDEPKYLDNVDFTLDDINSSIKNLKSVFDEKWTIQLFNNPVSNIIFPELVLMKGTQSLRFIHYLGRIIGNLNDSPGFISKTKDLKNEKSAAALLELEIANSLVESGYKISFPREGSKKKPDILVEKSSYRVSIECKRLNEEFWEKLERQLHFRLTPILPSTDIMDYQITLNPRITDLFFSGEHENLNDSIMDGIVGVIDEALKKLFAIKGGGIADLEDLGHIVVKPRSDEVDSWVTGCNVSAPAKMRRILSNGVLRAFKQLPEDNDGLVVVFSNLVPEPILIKNTLDAIVRGHEEYRNIKGVILLPQQFILSKQIPPVIWKNRIYSMSSLSEEVINSIAKQFGANIV